MGRPPAYVFIVRHGDRLDAADKLWHLSSPTPYDPPLTYGGWIQSRAIGQRIADILRENPAPLESPVTPHSGSHVGGGPAESRAGSRKRRYKIVIHSSPFLRCMQTSIAVGAGLSSDSSPLESARTLSKPLPPLRHQPPNQKTPEAVIGERGHKTNIVADGAIRKSIMRLDAFLGEWLSPGYFELITPPPSSVMMIAGAKAELLRREDYSTFSHTSTHHTHAHSQSTSQLWGASRPKMWSSQPPGQDESQRSNPQSVSPTYGLYSGGGSGVGGADNRPYSSGGSPHSPRWSSGIAAASGRGGYVFPTPHFALSSKAPAPTGFIAHARDACINVDYQWDSMRAPYDWGDGGEFGEEWTAMHRRFRKGLQKLVDWYATADAPTEMVTKTIHFDVRETASRHKRDASADLESPDCAVEDDPDDAKGTYAGLDGGEDEEDYVEEPVVILVSHGAGCNAMIGAITQQPVLMDVGLASLSVAVRKPGKDKAQRRSDAENEGVHTTKRVGAHAYNSHIDGVAPLNQYYEMKVFANTDHLRSSPTTPTIAARPSNMAMAMGTTRGRHSNSLSSTLGNFGTSDIDMAGHRSASAGSFHGGSNIPTRRPSGASSRPIYHAADGSGGGAGGGSIARATSSNRASGITIGSGITSFSPTSLSTSRLGRGRTTSIGLWSPVDSQNAGQDGTTFENDDDENDDIEILLSFGPESSKSKEGASSTASTSSDNKATSSDIAPARSSSTEKSVDTRTANAMGSVDATVTAAMPQLGLGSPRENSGARDDSNKNNGLWGQPRSAMSNSTEQTNESANSKRRWTLNDSSTR
ncbi:phosphoglycerate mutase family protein [Niveomyces insectorum RCEF 264]|uniref:Phosphoglycerate mutase family protein n=1 Tax=Niveomyces insectorum RCEF 264 TaxID=1081102 RepID=A0A167YNF2_9HYPO|nr:phosphoglycerate mutase family protein [Niveomyces insectorum RCEF 264]